MVKNRVHAKIHTCKIKVYYKNKTLIHNIYCKLSLKSVYNPSRILISGLSDHLTNFLLINLCKYREINEKNLHTNRHSSDPFTKCKGTFANAKMLEKK